MPQAVLALPYVAWILLATMSIGAMAFVFITRYRTDATRGYLRFTAVLAALLALLAVLVDWGLTEPTNLIIQSPTSNLDFVRRTGLALIALVPILMRKEWINVAAPLFALGTTACLLGAAFGWAPTQVDAVPLLIQLVVLSLATGGSLAAVILGHWYLVTPKISEKPLILQARMLMAIVALQLALFIVWTTLGGGPGQDAFDAFTGGNLLLVVLRLLVTLIFPLVLCWMAWRTAQTRSMESATGLLYINLAAVMAGTIGAAALYVSSGLLI